MKWLKKLTLPLILMILFSFIVISAGLYYIQKIFLINNNMQPNSSSSSSSNTALPVSAEVAAARGIVTEYAKKYGIEEYVDLLLAIMHQESGGRGNDVFQASESLGLPPNTLGYVDSIKQGCKITSDRIRAAGVKSPSDIDGIKLALQGYNFGGGYITYALKEDGRWTQENTFAYAKKHSKGKRNVGKKIEQFGPWHYGDQYYTQHVLRFYSYGACNGDDNVDGNTIISGNGTLKNPCPKARITSEFGPRRAPVAGASRDHKGRDYGAPVGTPIYASASGTVEIVSTHAIRGNYVVINHGNGLKTYYQHNSKNLVKVGQKVQVGQEIAKVGRTGRVSGPHLHFEVHVNGKEVDPRKYL